MLPCRFFKIFYIKVHATCEYEWLFLFLCPRFSFSCLISLDKTSTTALNRSNASVHYFFPFIFISWRLITLQYCSGFCHTLTWISHGFTCFPHSEPPSHHPPHPIPLGHPSAPAPSTCLMHPTWAGDLFHTW